MSGNSNLIDQSDRPRWISTALIVFALIAVPIGLMDPHGRAQHGDAALTLDRRQLDRADRIAGFAVPPHSEETPRGPEP